MKLAEAFRQLLEGWRSDVDPRWLTVLDGVEPGFAGVDGTLDLEPADVIFPGRKGRAPAGARPDSHIFRALDGMDPDAVSVVVIGQDPYQKVAQATGRSFEQGDLQDWLGQPRVSPSLQRIIQALAHARSGDVRYVERANGWNHVVNDIGAGTLNIAAPRPLWDSWQSQGVLFINAIFTFTRVGQGHQFDGHAPLWAPILRTMLGHVVRRVDKPVVFVAWGGKAQKAFAASGAKKAAQDAGTWGRTVTLVERPHPNARPSAGDPVKTPLFLRGSNPFAQINDALEQTGGRSINW